MTILRGHLAVTLVVAVPDEIDTEELRARLDSVRRRLELESVSLAEVEELEPGPLAEPSQIVSVYGADHPGIVHAFASTLAERGWNVTDLETRLVTDVGPEPMYVMLLELALTPGDSTDDLQAALEPVARSQGVEATARPLERDAAQRYRR